MGANLKYLNVFGRTGRCHVPFTSHSCTSAKRGLAASRLIRVEKTSSSVTGVSACTASWSIFAREKGSWDGIFITWTASSTALIFVLLKAIARHRMASENMAQRIWNCVVRRAGLRPWECQDAISIFWLFAGFGVIL